jgi:predicted ATP-dependent serine protease
MSVCDVCVNAVQPSCYVSLAAATAYLSLLFGLQLPPTFALCGEVTPDGNLRARLLHRTTIQAAHDAGITTIVVGHTLVSLRAHWSISHASTTHSLQS